MTRLQGADIAVANVVRKLAKGKDLRLADRGEVALKGFDEPTGSCTEASQIYSSPRIVSGGPLKGGIFKCQLKAPTSEKNQGLAAGVEAIPGEQPRHVALIEPGVSGDPRLVLTSAYRPVCELPEKAGQAVPDNWLNAYRVECSHRSDLQSTLVED
jgi:hypothetical protein